MQQIADWLEKLGMSEYAERFALIKITPATGAHVVPPCLAVRYGVGIGAH
jgi:hypothetical protein